MLFSALVMRHVSEKSTSNMKMANNASHYNQNNSLKKTNPSKDLICLAQQVQGGQLTRCLPASYGSGAVTTVGPFA